MDTLEIIIAAMNQTDDSIVKRMNLRSDAVIANQCGVDSIYEKNICGHRIRMISTRTRGVGLNRNLGLLLAEADILMFADEDVVYNDHMPDIVRRAFAMNPKADVILFGFSFMKNGEIYKDRIPKNGRIPFHRAFRYGTCSIAIRRKAVLCHNLSFTQLFGGGCVYSHGEDSDFLIQCYRKKLRVFGCSQLIGITVKDTSTCFTGYRDKYFYDTGALARHSFGILAAPYMLYMAVRTGTISKLKFMRKISLMLQGYRGFSNMIGFHENTPVGILE